MFSFLLAVLPVTGNFFPGGCQLLKIAVDQWPGGAKGDVLGGQESLLTSLAVQRELCTRFSCLCLWACFRVCVLT